MPSSQAPELLTGDDLLTVDETAAQIRNHPATIRRWIKVGILHAHKLPTGGLRIPATEVARILGTAERS
jgi:excisionase family DNA binding protein